LNVLPLSRASLLSQGFLLTDRYQACSLSPGEQDQLDSR
jgi:hypothetical protein